MAVNFSLVAETPSATPDAAHVHFLNKLSVETDVADVRHDLEFGLADFVLIDVRSAQEYAEGHIPNAMNLPYRTITEKTTDSLCKEKLLVVYCWGPACNGATKAAARLSALGYQVKEMLGGMEYWQREGGKVEVGIGEQAPVGE